MERVSIANLDSTTLDGDRRGLSDPLGTTDVAINHYRLSPDEGFPGGLHAHMDQEEVFVVSGEATFATMDGELTVGAGEAIRFAPGEFQSGRNASDEDLVAFVIGAPRNSEDIRLPLKCPVCDHEDVRIVPGSESVAFVCSCSRAYPEAVSRVRQR